MKSKTVKLLVIPVDKIEAGVPLIRNPKKELILSVSGNSAPKKKEEKRK